MPFLSLDLKCHLVGVTNLRPADPDNFRWHIKVKCTNCGETPESWHYVVLNEEVETANGKSTVHLIEKCKLCGRTNTLEIVKDSVGSYSIDKNEEWQSIVRFDFRGIEPVEFDPRIGWTADGAESNTVFDDIDLNDKCWADFDEKTQEPTEINDLQVRFVHAKK